MFSTSSMFFPIEKMPEPAKMRLFHYLEDKTNNKKTSLIQLSRVSLFWENQVGIYKANQNISKNYFSDSFRAGDHKKTLNALADYLDLTISSPIVIAVIKDDCDTFINFLREGDEKQAEDLVKATYYGPNFSECLVHIAVRFNSINCLEVILEEIRDVNIRITNYYDCDNSSNEEENALELAVYFQRYECAQLLLECGANPLEIFHDRPQSSAYEIAEEQKDRKMLELMIKVYQDFVTKDVNVPEEDKEILNTMLSKYEVFLSERTDSPTSSPRKC